MNLKLILLTLVLGVQAFGQMKINLPPNPFLDAKDLNQRYATQIRKLSNAPILTDGDTSFKGVDTFRPPQELEPGVMADAVNKRCEDGRAWPRNGVNTQAWGAVPVYGNFFSLNVAAGLHWPAFPSPHGFIVKVPVVANRPYRVFALGNATTLLDNNGKVYAVGTLFTAQAGLTYTLFAGGVQPSSAVTALILLWEAPPFSVHGYGRFNDPQGFDTQVVLTDDWRQNVGEDGGRGRCWRILPGNMPLNVPMNGHDIWDTARAIPCFNGLVMLRQGNERHYFSAYQYLAITGTTIAGSAIQLDTTILATGNAVTVSGVTGAAGTFYVRIVSGGNVSLYDTSAHAIAGGGTGLFAVTVNGDTGQLNKLTIDPAASNIQLNTTPDWVNGDLVEFVALPNSIFTPQASSGSVPNPGSRYYVKTLAGNLVQLYSDQSLTQQIKFNGCTGSFYLERQASFPGFYGNGAPPLLAQPNLLGNTLWDTGFQEVPDAVQVTNVAANVITAANHNLLPADAVTITGVLQAGGTALPSPVYVNPTSPFTITLYNNSDNALAAGATGLIALQNNSNPDGTIVKVGSSGLPMPSGREGCYLENRLVIINQSCTLAVSDPLDPLHYTPFTAAVTANLGESDVVTSLVPLPLLDSLLILKQNEVLLLNNFSQGSAAWTLTTVTREYGCFAPLTAVQVGADVWFLSRKGVASIEQTVQGITQGVAEPVSKAMKKYIDLIDWRYAQQATACYWNNRFYIALPMKGQVVAAGQTPVNNGWLVYNFLNQMWEGLWNGAQLVATGMSRLNVYGEERLTFVNQSGQVCSLNDGFVDGATPIADSLTTRIYTCGAQMRKLHLAVDMTWDAYAPSITVTGQTPGVNETETLLPAPLVYDPTQYAVNGLAAYVPGTGNFGNPSREDYQMNLQDLVGGQPDLHQNHNEGFRMRLDDWGVQFVIANTTGSLRVQSVSVRAVAGPNLDSTQV